MEFKTPTVAFFRRLCILVLLGFGGLLLTLAVEFYFAESIKYVSKINFDSSAYRAVIPKVPLNYYLQSSPINAFLTTLRIGLRFLVVLCTSHCMVKNFSVLFVGLDSVLSNSLGIHLPVKFLLADQVRARHGRSYVSAQQRYHFNQTTANPSQYSSPIPITTVRHSPHVAPCNSDKESEKASSSEGNPSVKKKRKKTPEKKPTKGENGNEDNETKQDSNSDETAARKKQREVDEEESHEMAEELKSRLKISSEEEKDSNYRTKIEVNITTDRDPKCKNSRFKVIELQAEIREKEPPPPSEPKRVFVPPPKNSHPTSRVVPNHVECSLNNFPNMVKDLVIDERTASLVLAANLWLFCSGDTLRSWFVVSKYTAISVLLVGNEDIFSCINAFLMLILHFSPCSFCFEDLSYVPYISPIASSFVLLFDFLFVRDLLLDTAIGKRHLPYSIFCYYFWWWLGYSVNLGRVFFLSIAMISMMDLLTWSLQPTIQARSRVVEKHIKDSWIVSFTAQLLFICVFESSTFFVPMSFEKLISGILSSKQIKNLCPNIGTSSFKNCNGNLLRIFFTNSESYSSNISSIMKSLPAFSLGNMSKTIFGVSWIVLVLCRRYGYPVSGPSTKPNPLIEHLFLGVALAALFLDYISLQSRGFPIILIAIACFLMKLAISSLQFSFKNSESREPHIISEAYIDIESAAYFCHKTTDNYYQTFSAQKFHRERFLDFQKVKQKEEALLQACIKIVEADEIEIDPSSESDENESDSSDEEDGDYIYWEPVTPAERNRETLRRRTQREYIPEAVLTSSACSRSKFLYKEVLAADSKRTEAFDFESHEAYGIVGLSQPTDGSNVVIQYRTPILTALQPARSHYFDPLTITSHPRGLPVRRYGPQAAAAIRECVLGIRKPSVFYNSVFGEYFRATFAMKSDNPTPMSSDCGFTFFSEWIQHCRNALMLSSQLPPDSFVKDRCRGIVDNSLSIGNRRKLNVSSELPMRGCPCFPLLNIYPPYESEDPIPHYLQPSEATCHSKLNYFFKNKKICLCGCHSGPQIHQILALVAHQEATSYCYLGREREYDIPELLGNSETAKEDADNLVSIADSPAYPQGLFGRLYVENEPSQQPFFNSLSVSGQQILFGEDPRCHTLSEIEADSLFSPNKIHPMNTYGLSTDDYGEEEDAATANCSKCTAFDGSCEFPGQNDDDKDTNESDSNLPLRENPMVQEGLKSKPPWENHGEGRQLFLPFGFLIWCLYFTIRLLCSVSSFVALVAISKRLEYSIQNIHQELSHRNIDNFNEQWKTIVKDFNSEPEFAGHMPIDSERWNAIIIRSEMDLATNLGVPTPTYDFEGHLEFCRGGGSSLDWTWFGIEV
eukprot:GHVP01003530.1.p1 GENE.GHVP01003530.1~~GHVP01003530.1.p1  ORF type:complete len:1354 (-),score=250.99 GHVP01003530.1:192-4253(-)